MWEFPEIRGTFLGVHMIRIIIVWGLYLGPLIVGNYHIRFLGERRRPTCKQSFG